MNPIGTTTIRNEAPTCCENHLSSENLIQDTYSDSTIGTKTKNQSWYIRQTSLLLL